MRTVRFTSQFKKDLKRAKRRGKDTTVLKTVLAKLANEETLAPRFRDHALTGNYAGTRECHLEPDWLLIYRLLDDNLILIRTGTHADLF
jgi:mRNA interferase YafQ